MKHFHLFILALFTLFLAGCTSVTEKFKEFVGIAVDNESITPEQGNALVELWTQNAGSDWWQTPLTVVTAIVLHQLGIRSNLPIIGRGSPTQKVGLPASKIQVDA